MWKEETFFVWWQVWLMLSAGWLMLSLEVSPGLFNICPFVRVFLDALCIREFDPFLRPFRVLPFHTRHHTPWSFPCIPFVPLPLWLFRLILFRPSEIWFAFFCLFEGFWFWVCCPCFPFSAPRFARFARLELVSCFTDGWF